MKTDEKRVEMMSTVEKMSSIIQLSRIIAWEFVINQRENKINTAI